MVCREKEGWVFLARSEICMADECVWFGERNRRMPFSFSKLYDWHWHGVFVSLCVDGLRSTSKEKGDPPTSTRQYCKRWLNKRNKYEEERKKSKSAVGICEQKKQKNRNACLWKCTTYFNFPFVNGKGINQIEKHHLQIAPTIPLHDEFAFLILFSAAINKLIKWFLFVSVRKKNCLFSAILRTCAVH